METRRIYVACIAAYDNGILHGAWIETEGKDEDQLQDEVNAILAASPIEDAEEYAIHDHEGFGGLLGEYTSLKEVAAIESALDEAGGDDIKQAAFWYLISDLNYKPTDAAQKVDDVCIMEGTVEDYAYDLIEDCYFTKDTPDIFRNYFDYDSFARDLKLNGVVDTFEYDGTHYVITNAGDL